MNDQDLGTQTELAPMCQREDSCMIFLQLQNKRHKPRRSHHISKDIRWVVTPKHRRLRCRLQIPWIAFLTFGLVEATYVCSANSFT